LEQAQEAKRSKVELRREKLTSLLADNDQLTNPELAALLGVSIGTIKGDKKALNGALVK
jgi:DeoR/GlpR family transcriptional regulator of sugar metabolism